MIFRGLSSKIEFLVFLRSRGALVWPSSCSQTVFTVENMLILRSNGRLWRFLGTISIIKFVLDQLEGRIEAPRDRKVALLNPGMAITTSRLSKTTVGAPFWRANFVPIGDFENWRVPVIPDTRHSSHMCCVLRRLHFITIALKVVAWRIVELQTNQSWN